MTAPPPISESEARNLADAINQVSSSRSPAEAQKVVDMALSRAPGHPIVLNAAAGHMLRTGRAAQGRTLFERALAVDAKSRILWLNLATACRSLGDTTAEGAVLEKALALEPRYVAALLHKGDLMERLGNAKAAALTFEAALASIPPGEAVPQHMAPAVAHAREVVGANARARWRRFWRRSWRQVRIILIFDIWNPLLTAAERDLVRAMTVGRGRFYGSDAPTMGSR